MASATSPRPTSLLPAARRRSVSTTFPTRRPVPPATSLAEVGTFKDNKRAPIHRWFQYPAGFSYRAVEHALDSLGIAPGSTVYDPFAGTGTTLVACKTRGIASCGVEAHPLVARIARTKVRWDLDLPRLREASEAFLARLGTRPTPPGRPDRLPELVRKCYGPKNLSRLLHLRSELPEAPAPFRDLFEVALVSTLRGASGAATGWPYIAPRKRIEERNAYEVFAEQLRECVSDLEQTPPKFRKVRAEVREGDARAPGFPSGSIDLAFTSPPYLNNYDYADRLRLETYFLGMADTWGEISDRFRSRLIVAATTQVLRGDRPAEEQMGEEVEQADPDVAGELRERVRQLSELRRRRSGHKSYDLMVARYFTDMTRAMAATRSMLRPGSPFVLILGDSAPYGVPIPTEEYLGRIGVGLGFSEPELLPLRRRGDKWRSNPQRHHVPLRETWLQLRR